MSFEEMCLMRDALECQLRFGEVELGDYWPEYKEKFEDLLAGCNDKIEKWLDCAGAMDSLLGIPVQTLEETV